MRCLLSLEAWGSSSTPVCLVKCLHPSGNRQHNMCAQDMQGQLSHQDSRAGSRTTEKAAGKHVSAWQIVMPGQQARLLSHLHDVEDILAHGAGQRLERNGVLVAVHAEVLDQEAGTVLLVPLVADGAGVLLAAQGLLAKGAGAALQARDHGQAAAARPAAACRGSGEGSMRLWWPRTANVVRAESLTAMHQTLQ